MITKLSDSLMLFYIIMVASYFTNFLSCDLQRLFTNNLLAKHIIAFISAFFLITLVEDANVESLPEMLKLTVIIYAVYILSTKTKAFIILPVLMVLFIDQMIKVQVDILESIGKRTESEYQYELRLNTNKSKIRLFNKSVALAMASSLRNIDRKPIK